MSASFNHMPRPEHFFVKLPLSTYLSMQDALAGVATKSDPKITEDLSAHGSSARQSTGTTRAAFDAASLSEAELSEAFQRITEEFCARRIKQREVAITARDIIASASPTLLPDHDTFVKQGKGLPGFYSHWTAAPDGQCEMLKDGAHAQFARIKRRCEAAESRDWMTSLCDATDLINDPAWQTLSADTSFTVTAAKEALDSDKLCPGRRRDELWAALDNHKARYGDVQDASNVSTSASPASRAARYKALRGLLNAQESLADQFMWGGQDLLSIAPKEMNKSTAA